MHADKVVLAQTPWRIVVSTSRHALTLFRTSNAVGTVSVVVGKPSTPTPDGLSAASLQDPLGTALSHGCIRLSNDAIEWLLRTVGPALLPGTPVQISR